nr:DUF4241 domain-containing protein [Paracoccaceae bacterium]
GEAYGAFANGELMARAFPDASGIPQDFVVTRAGLSMAVFSSGWGDGWYASYWGFDQSGCLCALVTDFGVLDGGYPYASPLRTPGHGARPAPDTPGWGGDCPRPGT